MEQKSKVHEAYANGFKIGMKYKWGEPLWQLLYSWILYEIYEPKKIINVIKPLIPCKSCRLHLDEKLVRCPIPNSTLGAFQWCVDLEKEIEPHKVVDRYTDVIIHPNMRILQKQRDTNSRKHQKQKKKQRAKNKRKGNSKKTKKQR